MSEELLPGGNTHEVIVRVGETVRRPTGPWTPGVHAVLRHLEEQGFEGAPRPLGIDDEGREILTFVPGHAVYPDHLDDVASDDALAGIAALIRGFHDAVSTFDPSGFEWSDRGADGRPGGDLVCHNDLAPWNLVHGPDGSWAFVDWDLAAPGRRSWDLAWSLLTLVPLMPDFGIPGADAVHRLRVFRAAYGADHLDPSVVDVARARCEREAFLIRSLGTGGDPTYERLLAEGHAETWEAAAAHVEANADRWKGALSRS